MRTVFGILIPDVLDSHFKPGFVATHNSATLENGTYTIKIDKRPPGQYGQQPTSKYKYDCCPGPRPSPLAYAVIYLPKPDYVHGITPTTATILKGSSGGQEYEYVTRTVLLYENVDLGEVHIPNVDFHEMAMKDTKVTMVKTDHADIQAFGGVGLLVLEMKPLEQTNNDHAMMAYRAMAKMLGVTRHMRPVEANNSLLEKGRYNDCLAATIFVPASDKK
jgi:hypothetical protein